MEMRKYLRDAFNASVGRGEYPTGWLLRIGSIERLALDTEIVLGYRPKRIDGFLGLPITACPAGSANRLITATAVIALPDQETAGRTKRPDLTREDRVV